MAKMTKQEIAAYNADVARLEAASDASDRAKREWDCLRENERKMMRDFDARWNPDMQRAATR